MLSRGYAACVVVLVLAGQAPAADAQTPGITLSDALRRASQLNPDNRLAAADTAAASAARNAARTWIYNPEFGVGVGRLREADSLRGTYDFGLAQRFEIGGKRGARIEAADRIAEATSARLIRRREEVTARVTRAFLLAQIGRMRVATTLEAEQVALNLRAAADERLAQGAGTRLEVNVAAAAVSRDRWRRLLAEQAYASAVLNLAAEIGLPATERPEPIGDFPLVPRELRPESTLVALAVEGRADLRAMSLEREAAAATHRFATRLWVPDPAVTAAAGQDENRFVTFGLSVPIPLFNRGQPERAFAAAQLARAAIIEAAGRQQVQREVQDAFQAFTRAADALAGFDRDVVDRLTENLSLAEESFRAGKIGLLVFSTVRRDLVEARLSYLDALGELIEQRIALGLAVGELPSFTTERQ